MKKYIENSAAIHDSLTRYEFAKLHISKYKNDIRVMHQINLGYRAQNIIIKNSLRASDQKLAQKDAQLLNSQQRFKNANLERWGWRGLAAAILIILLK